MQFKAMQGKLMSNFKASRFQTISKKKFFFFLKLQQQQLLCQHINKIQMLQQQHQLSVQML
jgi:hypothetical protein